ncbi:hypothetical protein [Mucilaginibacter antarcticus]|uniref:hypothetical protein n=1 Tax=Mucilaginibacter antarcticus TaxID=1855725 RepID=UPI00363648F2
MIKLTHKVITIKMTVGVPKEIKNNENRVALTPVGAEALVAAGHKVYVQKTAGEGSGFTDAGYVDAGATLVDTAAEAWSFEMVMKVKEPVETEFQYFRSDLVLFTYLHLAAEPKLTSALLEKKLPPSLTKLFSCLTVSCHC